MLENMVIIWPPIERLLVFIFPSTQQDTFLGTHAAAFLVSFSGAASTMYLLYYEYLSFYLEIGRFQK